MLYTFIFILCVSQIEARYMVKKAAIFNETSLDSLIESEEEEHQDSHTLQLHNTHLKEGDLEHQQKHKTNTTTTITNTTTPENGSIAQDDLTVHKLLNIADKTNINQTLLHTSINSTSSSEQSTELEEEENKVEDANVEEGLEHGYASNYAEAAE